jgi:hypothetical protein
MPYPHRSASIASPTAHFCEPIAVDTALEISRQQAGFNAAPGILTTDLDGNPRVQNATGISEPFVDMGAYEAAGAPESRLISETALISQLGTVFYDQPVNLSTTVTDSNSATISSGTVNILDDWSPIQQSALSGTGIAAGSTSSLAL